MEAIDSADRSLLHALSWYFKDFKDEFNQLGELMRISMIKKIISEVHEGALLGKNITAGIKVLVERDIKQAEVLLEGSRNIIKSTLLEQFKDIEKFMDSL